MKKSSKRNIIITSLAAIAAAGAVVVGSTYALFTSESKTNIAVTAGKVSVVATLDDLKTYSGIELTGDAASDSVEPTAEAGVFTNGGTAKIENNELVLDKMTPGDKVEFDIKVANNSDVAVQYRTIIKTTEDNGLFSGLKVSIGEEVFYGFTSVSKLEALAVNSAEETIHVVIELPSDAGNEYQGKSTKISYAVEAYQGNASIEEAEDNELCLYNAFDLITFAKLTNTKGWTEAPLKDYTTFTLMDDVDLEGVKWTPIVFNSNDERVFDGNYKTISNLTVDTLDKDVGMFSYSTGNIIKNVKLDKAYVKGVNRVAAIAGHAMCAKISNCEVTNSKIVAATWWDPAENQGNGGYNDGDKAGAFAGYLSGEPNASVTGCKVENTVIEGYRDVGSLVGIANASNPVVKDNSAKDVTIINHRAHNYKNYQTDDEYHVNQDVGEKSSTATVMDNTIENVTISVSEDE